MQIVSAEIHGTPATAELTRDRLRLTPRAPLQRGEATIRIIFRGLLGDAPRGLYLTNDCAVTQLQPTYARTLFPCFDEPRMKATFDVTVSAASEHRVISNGIVIGDERSGDRHRVTFATTPRMPPYLLGIAIGAFASIDAASPRAIRFHAKDTHNGAFALDAAQHFLGFYDAWFDVAYDLPKLDLVAIPDFDAGGMENTGAIFFRDADVRIDAQKASGAAKRHAANLVAHELAHHWFGSLVTPAAWDDLWLNEGCATWIAPKAVAAWDASATRDVEELQAVRAAMTADSLASSRSLRAGATTSAAIKELFDPIAYRKGAAILRMLESWLGEETFRRGVNLYVARHAHRIASSTDLWDALGEASGIDVASVAMSFVTTPGVPQLAFSSSGDAIHIAQHAHPPRKIPLAIKVGFEDGRVEVHRTLLDAASVSLPMRERVQWVFGNADPAGYYRASHADVDAIPMAMLSRVEQMTLLEDTWDAMWSGTSDTLQYLRVAGALLQHEVFPSAIAHFAELRELLATGARRAQFDAWITRNARPSDDEATFALLGAANDAATIAKARERVEDETASIIAARHGDAELFDRLLAARQLRAVASFESPALRDAQLAVLHQTELANPDALTYFDALLANPAAREAAWRFLKANWEELRPKLISFGGRGAILSLGSFADPAVRADIASFFAGRDVSGAERALRQTLERIDGRIRFREREQRRFDAWLVRQSNPSIEANEPLVAAHGLLNALTAGFHGALYMRVLFERMGVQPQAWMHPPQDLRSALSGLERLFLQLFLGIVRVDESVMNLAARMSEDLEAMAQLATVATERVRKSADAESATIVSIVLARDVATREHALDGALAFAALFGAEAEANEWRRQLQLTAADADRARRWLQRAGQTGMGRALREELADEGAAAIARFRSRAAELKR